MDTNIVAYALIQGDKSASAHQLRGMDADWRLPGLWRHEFLSVLTQYVQHGGVPLKKAMVLWDKALKLFSPCEQSVNMLLALELAATYEINAYDAQFMALAQLLNVPCITEDRKLLRKFPRNAASMEKFLASGPKYTT